MTTKETKVREAEAHIEKLIAKAAAKGLEPGRMVEAYRRSLEVLKAADENYFAGDNEYTDAATLLYINSDLE